MKKIVCLLAMLWMGCNNAPETNSTPDSSSESPVSTGIDTTGQRTSLQPGCYRAVQGRDTILLQLNFNGSFVTGQMQYDNFEMDGNVGSIDGVQQGRRINGIFTYFSEGAWSVRELVLEEHDGTLLQADTRQMKLQADTLRFTDTDSLRFDSARPFRPIACPELVFTPLPPKNT